DRLALRFVEGVDPHGHRLPADTVDAQELVAVLGGLHQLVQVTGRGMSRPTSSAPHCRYHRRWGVAQKGMATSSSSQVAPCRAPSTTSSVVASATSSGTGARKPGSASSGM